MLDGAFSFRGRIGRLTFFLDSLVLGAIGGFGVIVVVLLAMPARNVGLGVAFVVLAMVVALPVLFWVSLSLQARRLRDVGLDPVLVLPLWVAAGLADPFLAMAVPRLAVPGGHGTYVVALLNLALGLVLLFWPGREADPPAPRVRPHPTRLQLVGGTAAPQLATSPALRPHAQGFGRRGLR